MNTTNDVVRLINTQPRILHLPDELKRVPGANGTESVVVVPTGRSLIPSVTRDPKTREPLPADKGGVLDANAVDRAYWERVKDHKEVRTWISKGWIRDERDQAMTMIPSLAGYGAYTAITIVEGEKNITLLTQWETSETRADVKAALATRLAQLTKPLPPIKSK